MNHKQSIARAVSGIRRALYTLARRLRKADATPLLEPGRVMYAGADHVSPGRTAPKRGATRTVLGSLARRSKRGDSARWGDVLGIRYQGGAHLYARGIDGAIRRVA